MKTAAHAEQQKQISRRALAKEARVSTMTAHRWCTGKEVREWARHACERAWIRLGGVVLPEQE